MAKKYFQTYDASGFVTGNYTDEMHGENIPAEAVEITKAEYESWLADPTRIIDPADKKPKNKPAKDAAAQLAEMKQHATSYIDSLKTQKAFFQALVARDLDADQSAVDAAVTEADAQAVLDDLP